MTIGPSDDVPQGRRHGGGGKGAKAPLKISKKGGKWKIMGYFHASKLLKWAFLSSLTRKYVFWKGFYHDFSTKKASASGGFLIPTKELCPLDPRGSFAPPSDLPWRRPWRPPISFNIHVWELRSVQSTDSCFIICYILTKKNLKWFAKTFSHSRSTFAQYKGGFRGGAPSVNPLLFLQTGVHLPNFCRDSLGAPHTVGRPGTATFLLKKYLRPLIKKFLYPPLQYAYF